MVKSYEQVINNVTKILEMNSEITLINFVGDK